MILLLYTSEVEIIHGIYLLESRRYREIISSYQLLSMVVKYTAEVLADMVDEADVGDMDVVIIMGIN